MTPLATELSTDPAGMGYAAIRATGDAGAVAAILNDSTKRTHVALAPLTVAGVLGGLGAAALTALWNNPNAATIRDDLRAQDRDAMGLWATMALAAGAVTQTEHDGVVAALTATSTQACSRAVELWGAGVTVSPDDVGLTMRTV